jgi:hypothetical protein
MAVLVACEAHRNAEGTPNRISPVACSLAWVKAIFITFGKEICQSGLEGESYLVLKIWQANAESAREPDVIALGDGTDRLVIIRYGCEVAISWPERGAAIVSCSTSKTAPRL